jgi:protocatechuate 3,4-dioxygenase beta subunit
VCDTAGVAEIALPKEVQIVRIWASTKGHSGMFANLQSQQDKELTIPEKFTFRLPPGTVMSGRVLDEAKKPIGGVKVKIDYAYQYFKPENFTVPNIPESETTTDAEGRWRFETIMPGSDVKVRLTLTHPDYVSDKVRQIGGEIASKQGVTEWQMRDGSAVIVMQRGHAVIGKVVDPSGHPVENALVAWGDDAYARQGSQDTRTKADGSFQLGAVPAGQTRLTVITDRGMPPGQSHLIFMLKWVSCA